MKDGEQDNRVRDYYRTLELPPERLEKLIQVTAEHTAEKEKSTSSGRLLAILSGLVFHPTFRAAGAAAMVLLVSLWMYNSGTGSESTERTLREVAMNHSTRLQPEYLGESLAMLDDSMQQLPFKLVLPKSVKQHYDLIGSRYCSLGGVLAAHLKFNDKESGKPISLFVAHNAEELQKINTQESTVEGVDVQFFREGGLFYALAGRS